MKIPNDALTNATQAQSVKKLVNSMPGGPGAGKDPDKDGDTESKESAAASRKESSGKSVDVTA